MGNSSTLTLKTTKEPAPPAAPTPLFPPSTTLDPGTRLASEFVSTARVPGLLGSPLSSSHSVSCSRHPSRSRCMSCVNGCVCYNSNWPPPTPSARLSLTVAFAATILGHLGSCQACHVQAKVVEVLNDFLPRFPLPLFRTSKGPWSRKLDGCTHFDLERAAKFLELIRKKYWWRSGGQS